jgi:hypothetical protein
MAKAIVVFLFFGFTTSLMTKESVTLWPLSSAQILARPRHEFLEAVRGTSS